MNWNDPIIHDAVRDGLKEISKFKKGSPEFEILNEQLIYVFGKQEEERNEESN